MRQAGQTAASNAPDGHLTRAGWRRAYVAARDDHDTPKPLSPAQQQIADAVAAARATVSKANQQSATKKPAKPRKKRTMAEIAAAAARASKAKQPNVDQPAQGLVIPPERHVRDDAAKQSFADLMSKLGITDADIDAVVTRDSVARDGELDLKPKPISDPAEDERNTKLGILQELIANFLRSANKQGLQSPACIRGLGAALVHTSGELAGYHKVPTDLPVEEGCWTSQIPSDSAGPFEVYILNEHSWVVLGSSLVSGEPKGWTIRATAAFPAAAELQFSQVFDFLARCASQWLEPRF
jgi:hypothetical protein